jgi:hypothetical protein
MKTVETTVSSLAFRAAQERSSSGLNCIFTVEFLRKTLHQISSFTDDAYVCRHMCGPTDVLPRSPTKV